MIPSADSICRRVELLFDERAALRREVKLLKRGIAVATHECTVLGDLVASESRSYAELQQAKTKAEERFAELQDLYLQTAAFSDKAGSERYFEESSKLAEERRVVLRDVREARSRCREVEQQRASLQEKLKVILGSKVALMDKLDDSNMRVGQLAAARSDLPRQVDVFQAVLLQTSPSAQVIHRLGEGASLPYCAQIYSLRTLADKRELLHIAAQTYNPYIICAVADFLRLSLDVNLFLAELTRYAVVTSIYVRELSRRSRNSVFSEQSRLRGLLVSLLQRSGKFNDAVLIQLKYALTIVNPVARYHALQTCREMTKVSAGMEWVRVQIDAMLELHHAADSSLSAVDD